MIGVVEMTSYPPPLQLENATNATSDCSLSNFERRERKNTKNPILIAFEEACFFYFFFNIHLNGGGKVSPQTDLILSCPHARNGILINFKEKFGGGETTKVW